MNNTKATMLGIQHLLAMYAGAILVPLIIGGALGFSSAQMTYLVAIDIFMCGVATLFQVWKGKVIGIGLPVVLGCTFTAVSPIIAIGSGGGLGDVYGAIIASGLIIVLIGGLFGKLIKFFPPVVTGSVVTIIGISLIPVAINNMAGGQGAADFASGSNVALAFITLLIILVIYRFTVGFVRAIAILLGMVSGTVIGIFMGKVDFAPVAEASWLHIMQPFYLATPTFNASAILTMTLVAMVSLVESTGVYYALSDITKKDLTSKDLSKGYRAEGLASIIGGIFNAFPYTTFSQNVGLIQMSGVRDRKVIFITGGMLVALGFLPKLAALTTIIPTPVLGAAMLAMFGMVITQGVRMLAPEIAKSMENAMVAALGVGLGIGVATVPGIFENLPSWMSILTSNGIVAGSATAIFLNVLFNMIGTKRVDPMHVME
ncbi:Putative purine permease ygfU [Solibacillus isronensis B3W22]|uniref:Putative purine permease ygfU n=1 Tax=Solibacillus isronensis B3W22 TaxID=1224748 RepID=K1KVU5_9BACL|nr:nucleobase:cation symporter-2 family protein [Solibacillus isronensis]AMO84023.1 xanthine permease [Solibacillus silvestris]EKB44012.1 Putative purine permease ygfU [Solibacillus isronensis B3W22]